MTTSAATLKREHWCNEVVEIATTHKMPTLAVMVIGSEWRSLGRSKGWKSAGGWFQDMLTGIMADGKTDYSTMEWFAIQSLIWFSREA